MNITTSILLPVILLASCATSATDSDLKPFNRADVDRDGKVSRSEATDLMIGQAFGSYDANRDGVVTRDEYVAGGGDAATFARIDSSGSGKVTVAEARSSPAAVEHMAVPFDEADVDKSGAITADEFLTYKKRLEAAVR